MSAPNTKDHSLYVMLADVFQLCQSCLRNHVCRISKLLDWIKQAIQDILTRSIVFYCYVDFLNCFVSNVFRGWAYSLRGGGGAGLLAPFRWTKPEFSLSLAFRSQCLQVLPLLPLFLNFRYSLFQMDKEGQSKRSKNLHPRRCSLHT